MACGNSSNKSLDPFDILLTQISGKVSSLERLSNQIQPTVEQFRNDLLGFDPSNISPSSVVNSALDKFTKEAICASSTEMEELNEFAEDCLNDAIRGIRQYLNDILQNIEDGIDLIDDLTSLSENPLMKLFQQIRRLVADIASLVSSSDGKIQCVTSLDTGGIYTSRVQTLEDRINTVLSDLYLDDDGNFDSDTLLADATPDLKTNLKSFETRANALQGEIESDVTSSLSFLGNTVNPKRKF